MQKISKREGDNKGERVERDESCIWRAFSVRRGVCFRPNLTFAVLLWKLSHRGANSGQVVGGRHGRTDLARIGPPISYKFHSLIDWLVLETTRLSKSFSATAFCRCQRQRKLVEEAEGWNRGALLHSYSWSPHQNTGMPGWNRQWDSNFSFPMVWIPAN